MKILAIRCHNLASLAEECSIDFRTEPLVSAGLFAICGPTGSGKSTVLDALCLALFEKTPRLHQAGSGIIQDVPDETVSLRDPRNLLRKGAFEGFAEVEFIGCDGETYRSRWSVRRARRRVDGKLQPTDMTFHRLSDGLPIGGKNQKDEVLAEIKKRLGLSFEQFCRAVLLAQNDFSAFLKAPDNERAQLLEMLTGTSACSELSMRAFVRAKQEQELLDRIGFQIADSKSLDPEQRKLHEERKTEADEWLKNCEERKGLLQKQFQWCEELDKWKTALKDAQEKWLQAQERKAAAGPRQKQLEMIDAVQESRPLVLEIDRLERERQEFVKEVNRAQAEREKFVREMALCHEQYLNSQTVLHAAEKNREEAKPELQKAKELDAEIRSLQPVYQEAHDTWQSCSKHLRDTQIAWKKKKDEYEMLSKDKHSLELWLAENESLKVLAGNIRWWNELLIQARDNLLGWTERKAAQQTLLERIREGEIKHRNVHTTLQTAEKMKLSAENAYAEAIEKCAGHDREALMRQRYELDDSENHLTQGERKWSQLIGKRQELGVLRQTLSEKENEIRSSEAKAQEIGKALEEIGPKCEQAEKLLRHFEASCNETVERMRKALEHQSACPVCGSCDHPYAQAKEGLREFKDQLKADVLRFSAEKDLLKKQETEVLTARMLWLNEVKQKKAQEELVKAMLQSMEAEWHSLPIALEVVKIVEEERTVWFGMQQKVIREQKKLLQNADKEMQNASKLKEQSFTALLLAQKQYEKVLAEERAFKASCDESRRELALVESEASAKKRQLDESLVQLSRFFHEPDWQKEWEKQPEEFINKKNGSVHQWSEATKRLEGITRNRQSLEIEMQQFEKEIRNAELAVQEAEKKYRAKQKEAAAKQAERNELFSGESAVRVEHELDRGIIEAKKQMERQRSIYTETKEKFDRIIQQCLEKKQILDMLQVKLSEGQQRLDEWLRDFPGRAKGAVFLEVDSLRTLLGYSQEWMRREREALKEIDDCLHISQSIYQEREKQKSALEQQQLTEDPKEKVQADLQTTMQELEKVRDGLMDVKALLKTDDAVQEKVKTLRIARQEQQEQSKVWSELSDLIGSADGKKFRNYAQQFTLDVLLSYANSHLSSLSPRYRLERIDSSLALQVVDQEMGEGIRSVYSLSGGESFLVSLALALGLASLSSNRIKVETLFIDEGFGSLDVDTLNIAMNALDSLQSQGRKVGVISHMKELTERIGTQIRISPVNGGRSRVEVIHI
jgi:exonuclease SbcC